MASSQKTDLVGIKGLKFSMGYFKENEFLSVENISQHLKRLSNSESLNYAGKDMQSTIEKIRSDVFLSAPVEFPVTGLQHTTTVTPMREILDSQSFKGRNPETAPRESELRSELMDFSFWAVDISSSDIENARKAAYTYVQKHLPGQPENSKQEIKQQFANSPAFNKSASRYGNFTFSFPFSDLLSLYGSQFCNGEKPQLSILGTDTYRLEIVHYVVVHRSDDVRFIDFPRVPILQTREEPLPFVYWMGDTLYWRPESTTDIMKVLTKDGEITKCPPRVVRQKNYDGDFCVWNFLTFAFHIPHDHALHVPVQILTSNLSSREALDPFMKDICEKMTRPRAEEIIEREKVKFQDQEAKDSKNME